MAVRVTVTTYIHTPSSLSTKCTHYRSFLSGYMYIMCYYDCNEGSLKIVPLYFANLSCIIKSHNVVSHLQVLRCYSLIIGILESVSNLDVTLINSTTIFISWSPPFTLEGVPILWYIVTITSGENMTVNNTWLYYPCHEPSVNITVVAVNGAGDGHPAMISFTHPSPSGKSNYFLSKCTCTLL